MGWEYTLDLNPLHNTHIHTLILTEAQPSVANPPTDMGGNLRIKKIRPGKKKTRDAFTVLNFT